MLWLAGPGVMAQDVTDPAAGGRSRFAPMVAEEAARRGLPPQLADAVITVESGYDPSAAGSSGEVGLMQVLPSTAAMLGFRGDAGQLADPRTNLRLGMDYLAGAWRMTGGRLCDTLTKYRAGYGQDSMSLRSIVYCQRARAYLASIGSPLATGPGTDIPAVTPGDLAGLDAAPRIGRAPPLLTMPELTRMRHGQRTAEDSRRYWVAEEARIRALRGRRQARRGGPIPS